MTNSLNCKEMDIEINGQNPFKFDKLNRESFANVLTHIIDTYSDTGCVLSLNGEWGLTIHIITQNRQLYTFIGQ